METEENNFIATRTKFKEVLLQQRSGWVGLTLLRSKVEFILSIPEIKDILLAKPHQKPTTKVRLATLNKDIYRKRSV